MSEWLPIALIISGILFVAGIVVVFLAWKRMKQEKTQESNYYSLFILGITWIPLGTGMMLFLFVTGNTRFFPLSFPLIGMGLVFLVIGLQHRDE